MVSEDELLTALKTSLEDSSQYARLQADLHTQVIRALGIDKQLTDEDKPQPPHSVAVANQVVREYLVWTGLKYTEMMFCAEASVPEVLVPSTELCQQLRVQDSASTEQLPLLLTMLSTFKKANKKDGK